MFVQTGERECVGAGWMDFSDGFNFTVHLPPVCLQTGEKGMRWCGQDRFFQMVLIYRPPASDLRVQTGEGDALVWAGQADRFFQIVLIYRPPASGLRVQTGEWDCVGASGMDFFRRS